MADNPEITPGGLTRTPAGTGLMAVGCASLAAAVVAVILATHPRLSTGAVVLHALAVAVPIAFGLFCAATRRPARISLALLAAGFLAVLVTFAESRNSTLYSAGRLAIWLLEPALIYLLLVFPLGRFTDDVGRRLFMAAVVVVAALYIPTVLVSQFPTPSPWASCGMHCPHNAFALTDSNSGFVDHFIRPLREVLTVVIYLGVAAVVFRCARRGGTLMRRTLWPLAIVAGFRGVAMAVYLPARGLGSTSGVADAMGWIFAFSLPLIALACAAGLVGQRVFAAGALQKLATRLHSSGSASEIQPALSEALGDPGLRVLFWVPAGSGRWVDENGWPVKAPEPGSGQAVTELRSNGRLVAAAVHDVALLIPALVETAAAYALTAVENERLVDRLQTSLRELADSRVRIISVTDRERRKIERDLHDGAQQRLVALRVKLELLAERFDADSPDLARAVRELEDEVDATLDEVRAFARGIYPALLEQRGLSEALRAAGRSAPLPTMVDAAGIGRYPHEVESTVYFACIEALQNVAKHADGATAAIIRVRENGRLEFEVRDDGQGFDAPHVKHGTGLAGLRDRVAAIGGEVRVESMPGRGTTVAGAVPVS